MPPGMRPIPDPEAEVERLAALRQQRADDWRVEPATVEGVRVTHLATGKSAVGVTQEEATGKLVMELVQAGDITINAGRGVMGLKPVGEPG